jgi:hypothetical protein
MGRAYFFDLRKRVVAMRGKSRRAVAALFDVSVASVVKWTQRAYETGRPMGGNRPYLLAGQRDWLLARLNEKPDLTLHALLTGPAAPLRILRQAVQPRPARCADLFRPKAEISAHSSP